MRPIAALLTLLAAGALAACDDPNDFRIDPLLLEDTVSIAAPSPTQSIASAVDLAAGGTAIGERYPEREADAERWDLTVRARGGEVLLVPASALGLNNPVGGRSRAAITPAIPGTFEALIEAPTQASFVVDSGVVARVGAVYAARSRRSPGGFGSCENYAKIQPLEVVPGEARVRLRIVVNQRCNDPRLVLED